MSTNPPDPRPGSLGSPSGAFAMLRTWMRTVVELNKRPDDVHEEFTNPPNWLRRALLVALALELYALTRLSLRDLPVIIALTIVYVLTMLIPPVPSPLGYIRTPRVAFIVTLILLWSPLHVLLVVAFGTLLGVVLLRLYEPWRALINTVLWAFPAALASWIGHAILGAIPGRLIGLTVASLTILVVYLVVNFALLALYNHFRRGVAFFPYWWSCVTENPLSQVLAAPLPILLGAVALGVDRGPWMALLLTALSAVTMPASRAQLAVFLASQRTVQDIVGALMIGLERSVPGAHAHARRVSDLVDGMGRRMRIPPATLESWRTAALLHDIGLIDADSRTASPMSHAIAGARILASYPDAIVADMVREHHTPWSAVTPRLRGAGGLGARVLAAAECYDELRHGTPATPGRVTHAATAAALRPLIGSQLDPRITSVLLETAERLERKAAS
ncbi:MAG TPA: HD domain-containing protein [bacterium]|nr:HD domain-containing protein [bacterium]